MTPRAILAYSSLILAAGAALADETPVRWTPYNAIVGTYLHADHQRDGDNGYGATSILGFSLKRNLNLEISGYGSLIDRDSDGGTDGLIGIGADLQTLFPLGRVQPFVIGGVGGEYDRLGSAAKHDSYAPYVDAGIGLIAPLTARLGLRAEARGYYVFNSTAYPDGDPQLDLRVGLGLQYRFGDRSPARAEPAPTVPASPQPLAPKLVDTDGDGVADKFDQCPGTPPGTAVDAKGCPLALDSDGDGVPDALDQCPGTPLGFKVDARGCIVEQIAVLKSINFDFGSDKLTSEAKSTLDQVAASLATQPTLRIEISGHTDALGPQAMNLTLSQKRAMAVKAYLVAHGVAGERLRAEGYGEFNPVASNDTEEGRAQNRRVEFKVLARPAGAR